MDFLQLSATRKDEMLNEPFHYEIDVMKWTVSHIYMLIDPRTDEIRYVGKSIRPYQRLQNHMNEPPTHCHRSHWLSELRSLGLTPRLEVLETLCGEWPWQEAECAWIARLRNLGARLVNNTDGGDGVLNLSGEGKKRMLSTWKGRKHRPESLLKMSLVRKGRKDRPESRRKRIETLKQIVHGEQWNERIAQANRKLTQQDISAILSALASGVPNKYLACQFGVHRTTISKVKMGTYMQHYRKHSDEATA